jgi:chromosome segregation ATPase
MLYSKNFMVEDLLDLIKTQHLKYDEAISAMQKQLDECERDRNALREDLVQINKVVSFLQEQINSIKKMH